MRIKRLLIIALLSVSFTAYADKTTGDINGDIRLDGSHPQKSAPAIVEYQGHCGPKRSTSVVRLWKNRVTEVTLWLTPRANAAPSLSNGAISSETTLNIIGKGCEFKPEMTIARPGTTVKIANEDPYTQWLIIEADGEDKRQIMQESEGSPVDITVKPEQNIYLMSGFYPWMEGWIKPVPDLVSSTVTEWDGRFYFKNMEPGEYTIHAWHPSLGELSQDIIVEADKNLDVEFRYQLPAEKQPPIVESTMLEVIFGGGLEEEKEENPFKTK